MAARDYAMVYMAVRQSKTKPDKAIEPIERLFVPV